MNVVFITPVTPYKENMRGPSGHPYHLMIERPDNIDITIYSFNNNHLSVEAIHEVEKELRVKIKLLEQPKWLIWILKLHLTFIRLLLKFPINYYIRLNKQQVKEIEEEKPDLIWGYCQEFSGILKQFRNFKRLHTVPDCYSLHFYRRLGKRLTLTSKKEYLRVIANYSKHYRMECNYDSSDNIVYHLVGEDDKNFLLEINPYLNAHFIRHPHYDVCTNGNDNANRGHFHQPKIKLLIAGQYNFYMKQDADSLIRSLTSNPSHKERGIDDLHKSEKSVVELLKEHYTITFLGKGWEEHVETLRGVGYEVNHIKFADNYIEEICKHDIQITPISIGTGTKGKVLDALANGLLVIGTPYAMENIAVKHDESCIEYRNPKEVIDVLMDILKNIQKYETMANVGQQQILKHHDRAHISSQLFSIVQ